MGSFYRPNAALCTLLEELDMSLHLLGEKFKNATIWLAQALTGQTPLYLWMQVMYVSTRNHLIDIVQDHGLHQLVTSPTRGINILDLFLSNDPSMVINIEILPGISDHEVL